MNDNNILGNRKIAIIKLVVLSIISITISISSFYLILNKYYDFHTKKVSDNFSWGYLEGFTSTISLAIIIGGLVFAIGDYVGKEIAKTIENRSNEREIENLSFDIYKSIFNMITDPEQELARRWVMKNIDKFDTVEEINGWYEKAHEKIMMNSSKNGQQIPEGQKYIKLILNCFDFKLF